MSTTAVTDGVCYIQSQDTVITRRALIASAARTVALVDHTKFAKRALHRLVELSTLDRVLVDSATPSAVVSGLRARGARIDIVAVNAGLDGGVVAEGGPRTHRGRGPRI